MVAVALAVPVQQQQQPSSVVPAVPALEGILVEATNEVEAVRKARQIGFGGLC